MERKNLIISNVIYFNPVRETRDENSHPSVDAHAALGLEQQGGSIASSETQWRWCWLKSYNHMIMKSLQLKRGQQKYLNIIGSLKILSSSWKNIVLVTWVTLCSEQLLWTPWNKTLFNSWYDRFTKGRVSVPKTKNLLKAMSMRKRLCSKLFLTDQRKTNENKGKQRKTPVLEAFPPGLKASAANPLLQAPACGPSWKMIISNCVVLNFLETCSGGAGRASRMEFHQGMELLMGTLAEWIIEMLARLKTPGHFPPYIGSWSWKTFCHFSLHLWFWFVISVWMKK